MEKMLEIFDPKSQEGMNIKLLIDQVKSSEFDESGFITWLKSDGVKTVGAIALAVVAAAAVASAFATFGATSPLAAAGRIFGYYCSWNCRWYRRLRAYIRSPHQLGARERTGARLFHAMRGGLERGEDGQAKRVTAGGALADYGVNFLYGWGILLATMGAGDCYGQRRVVCCW